MVRAPISVFESGAILQFVAEKTGRFLPSDIRARTETMQWLFLADGWSWPDGPAEQPFQCLCLGKSALRKSQPESLRLPKPQALVRGDKASPAEFRTYVKVGSSYVKPLTDEERKVLFGQDAKVVA